jgi:maleylacetoacetate isomerase
VTLKVYQYWRSSASYRVRIGLALKGVEYEYVALDISKDGGEQQFSPEYRALNPQSRLPFLVDGDFRLGQSLAILEYLDSRFPQPSLIPADPRQRARMWAFCHAIASDIQPLQNTGPLAYLGRELKASEEQRNAWVRHWIERGLAALEAERTGAETPFAIGDAITIADCVLVPQVYNAERFKADVARFPKLYALAERLRQLPAFRQAHPEAQPDAPRGIS